MHGGVSQVTDQHKVPYITSVGIYEPWVTPEAGITPPSGSSPEATGSFAE